MQCLAFAKLHVRMLGCGKILSVGDEIVANMLPTMFVESTLRLSSNDWFSLTTGPNFKSTK